MDVPEGHSLGADPRDFLEDVRPKIHQKLVDKILALNGVKFQLALRIQLPKTNPDDSEEFTSPVLRHRQKALLQADEIKKALDRAFPSILDILEKWTQRFGAGSRSGANALAGHRQVPATERRILHSSPGRSDKQEG